MKTNGKLDFGSARKSDIESLERILDLFPIEIEISGDPAIKVDTYDAGDSIGMGNYKIVLRPKGTFVSCHGLESLDKQMYRLGFAGNKRGGVLQVESLTERYARRYQLNIHSCSEGD